MNFYICTIILTELMMMAMTLHVVTYSGFTRSQKNWFIMTFVSVMFCAVAEFAVHCGSYDPALAVPLTVVTVLQFSVAPMLAVLFSGALGLHKQKTIGIIYLCVNLAVEATAAPFGLIFYFDEKGYHRGNYFLIYGAFYVISLIYLIVNMIRAGKKFRHRDMVTICMIFVVLIAGILPMILWQTNITYIAIAISASLCYIYYNDLVQQDIQAELVSSRDKMSEMQSHMISGLANLIENRDTETGEHITRTRDYVRILAERARGDGVYKDILTDHYIQLLQTLAPMHDIGKIIVPDRILKKPGKLTDAEFEEMKKHAALGGTVVREILNGVSDEEYLHFASDIATYHHERWDGTGYPEKLKGAEIPLSARIMAIADVFDALISKRCYKDAMPAEDAVKIIEEGSGSHFDPLLVSVFMKYKDDFFGK